MGLLSTHLCGFDRQIKLAGSCGRFALKHALLALGIPTTEREISRALGISRIRLPFSGMDEHCLLKGLQWFGLTTAEIFERDPQKARRAIDKHLDSGAPAIVCVDDWEHWAVLLGRSGGRYYWVDSADNLLWGTRTWDEVATWLRCDGEDRPYYAISARSPALWRQSRSFVPRIADVASMLTDDKLRRHWGDYICAVDIAIPHLRTRPAKGVPAQRFFAEAEPEILRACPPKLAIKRTLGRLRNVAVAHGVMVPNDKTTPAAQAIARVIERA